MVIGTCSVALALPNCAGHAVFEGVVVSSGAWDGAKHVDPLGPCAASIGVDGSAAVTDPADAITTFVLRRTDAASALPCAGGVVRHSGLMGKSSGHDTPKTKKEKGKR